MVDQNKSSQWFHNPKWEEAHAYHHERMAELRRLAKRYTYDEDPELYEENRKQLIHHQDEAIKAFVSGFPTAKDYAAFMLESVKRDYSHKHAWQDPNLSHIKTAEDAVEIYTHVRRHYEEQDLARRNAAPVDLGHPLFQSGKTQHFKTHIDYEEENIADVDILTNTITTIEELPERKVRVCFRESHKNHPKRSVTNGYEDMATMLYDNMLKGTYRPDQIEWYMHYDPTISLFKEKIIPIGLSFSGDRFCHPVFHQDEAFHTIPESLSHAEAEGMKNFIVLSRTMSEKTTSPRYQDRLTPAPKGSILGDLVDMFLEGMEELLNHCPIKKLKFPCLKR